MNRDLSLKEQLIKYVGYAWVNGGELERLALDRGYKASNGSRRARELAENGVWERKELDGSVWYRRKANDVVSRINAMQPFAQKKENKQVEVKRDDNKLF